MDRLVGVTEARDGFRDLLEEVETRDVVVLRHNKPVAVMVNPAKIERLFGRIEDLEDEVAILRYKYEPEETVSHEIVENETRASIN